MEYAPERFDLDPEVLLNAMRFRRSIRRFNGEKLTRSELENVGHEFHVRKGQAAVHPAQGRDHDHLPAPVEEGIRRFRGLQVLLIAAARAQWR